MKKILKTMRGLLVAAALCVGVNGAWADGETVGSTDNTTGFNSVWHNNNEGTTLAPNQTATFTFTNHSNQTNNWNNFAVVLATDYLHGADGYSEYVFLRADNYGWNSSANTDDNTWYTSLTSNYDWDNFKAEMDGANVVLTVTRRGAEAAILADITTSTNTKRYERFVLNCGDGTQNVRVYLTTEGGHLTDLVYSVADNHTETYDFNALCKAGNTTCTYDASYTTTINNISTKMWPMLYIGNSSSYAKYIGGRIATRGKGSSTNISSGVWFRNNGNNNNTGLQGNSDSKNEDYIAVRNLAVGDVVTFNFKSIGAGGAFTGSAVSAGDGSAITALVAGTTSVRVTSAGDLLYYCKGYTQLWSITVTTSTNESVSAPVIDNVTIPTLTSRQMDVISYSNNDAATIRYYYTKNATSADPATEGTVFTSPLTLNGTGVYYLYAVSNNVISEASDFELEARVTETFNFSALGNTYGGTNNAAQADANITYGDNFVYRDGGSDKTLKRLKYIGTKATNDIARAINGRIAVTGYWLRANGNGFQSNSANLNGYMAILGLKAGDNLTITGANLSFKTNNVSTAKNGESTTTLTSGTTYYALNDDEPIVIYGTAWGNIKNVVLNVTEDIVSEPVIKAIKVDGLNRRVIIEPYGTADDTSLVTTKYSTVSEEDAENGTIINSDTEVTVEYGTTLYAYAETMTGSTSNSSYTSPGEVKLNAPVFSINSWENVGDYRTATFAIANGNNSGLELSPEAEISLSFKATDNTVTTPSLTEGIYTPTGKGTLTITSSCEGYTSSSISINLAKFYSNPNPVYDFTTLTGDDMNGEFINGASPFNATKTTTWGNWPEGQYEYWQSTNTGNHYAFNALRVAGTALKLLSGYGLGNGGNGISVWFNNRVFTTGQLVEYTIFDGTNESRSALYYDRNNSLYYTIPANNVLKKVAIYSPIENPSINTSVTDYATFSAAYPLDFSAATGVKAYYASGSGASKVTMTKVTGTVAGGTGLLLQKTDGDINIPVAVSGEDLSATNLMKAGTGAAVRTEGNTRRYVLAGEGDATAFFELSASKDAVVIPTGKAYLEVTTENASRLFISFSDGETSGISQIENGRVSTEDAVYNLQGQRIANPTKGLYIVNGKKIIKH